MGWSSDVGCNMGEPWKHAKWGKPDWKKQILDNLTFFFFFSGPHLQHMEVPRPGVESELQLPATATVTWDLYYIHNLRHRSLQRWILDPQSEARDWTSILMDINQFLTCWTTTRTPGRSYLKELFRKGNFRGRKWTRDYHGLREEMGSYCLICIAEFVCPDEKVLEIDNGGTTVRWSYTWGN